MASTSVLETKRLMFADMSRFFISLKNTNHNKAPDLNYYCLIPSFTAIKWLFPRAGIRVLLNI